jgi:hypothetical protein
MEDIVASNLDVTNVKAVLSLSITHKADGLVEACSRFIMANFKSLLAHHKANSSGVSISHRTPCFSSTCVLRSFV